MYNFGRKERKNKNKIIFSILVVSILMVPLLSENEVKANIKIKENNEINIQSDPGWVKHFPGTSWGHVVRETDDGYIVVGATDVDDTGDGLVIKVDFFGNENWTKTFPNAAFEGLWITNDSGYIISGWKKEEDNYFGYLVKLKRNGTVEWEKTYGGPFCLLIQCQQTKDGGYAASGFFGTYGTNNQAWLLKTNQTGDILINETYGLENSAETFHSIYETSDGGFILPGWISTDVMSDGWVVKTDSEGNVIWDKYYGTGTSMIGLDKVDNINMGRQDSDGGYIFTGWSSASLLDKGAFWIFKTDENGNELWNKTYGRLFFHDLGLWIEPTSDGGYIAAGKKLGIGTIPNIILNGIWMPLWNNLWVIKIDSEGNFSWDITYRGATARCVQETSDGGYIIAGHKGPYYGTKGILLIKTDENGNID